MEAANSLSTQEIIALLSAIFTFGLFILYYFQYRISSRQTKIMENQEEMMMANHTPIIDIESISVNSRGEEYTPADMISLELINVGEGIAKRPGMMTYIEFDDEDYRGKEHYEISKRVPESQSDRLGYFSELASALEPNSEPYTYRTPVIMAVENKDTGEVTQDYAHNVLSDLFNNGVKEIEVKVNICVNDGIDRLHDATLFKTKVDLGELVDEERGSLGTYDELYFSELFIDDLKRKGVMMYEQELEVISDELTNKTGEMVDRAITRSLSEDGNTYAPPPWLEEE
ncbi:hypothetical protein ACLI4Z_16410 [Natrialbaceae archaeon A-arb3/5]